MSEEPRSIFRAEAVARRAETRAADAPQIFVPRTIGIAWASIGLCLAGVLVAWRTSVPVFVEGSGVVVVWKDDAPPERGANALLVILPSDAALHLAPGRDIFVRAADARSLRLVHVEASLSSPLEIERRFALGGAAAACISAPARVAIAALSANDPLARHEAEGSVVPIELAIGSRSALALVPWIGAAFVTHDEFSNDDRKSDPGPRR